MVLIQSEPSTLPGVRHRSPDLSQVRLNLLQVRLILPRRGAKSP